MMLLPIDARCPLCLGELPDACVCPPAVAEVARRELERELRLTRAELCSAREASNSARVAGGSP